MGRWRWTVNLGRHYEPPEPLDQTGPATSYPTRSGALPADYPWTEGASPTDRVTRNSSRRHRDDR